MSPERTAAENHGPQLLGVTGTVVEDTIDTADGVRTRDMGGITYTLATLSALLPERFRIRPVLAVGADAFPRVRDDLATLPGVSVEGLVPVAAMNNKVHIEYADDGSRAETLTGGVPPLSWEVFEPWLPRLDAWLWNFISGMEVERGTFERVKASFRGPLYVDLHSLCLEHVHGGARHRRRPPDWETWVAGVTWLQLNAEEAGLLWRDRPAPLERADEAALAARVHDLGVSGMLVTRGGRGATWYGADAEVANEPASHAQQAVDPTGCGDVFGAAWVALHLGRGLPPEEALAGAAAAAGLAATIRGTRGLREALRSAGLLSRASAWTGDPHGA